MNYLLVAEAIVLCLLPTRFKTSSSCLGIFLGVFGVLSQMCA